MRIKKYQNTPGRLPKPIATSDMTSHVAAMPLRQQRADVGQQTLNINRMRSTDAKEREAGRKAEVQRRKQKRSSAKQTANPHVDAASIPDNQFAMNVGDAAIEQQVAQEADRNNPYGAYRLSLNQGALRGLSDDEWKESRGTLMNLADKLDGDNMFSRGLKRELTEMSQGRSFVNGLWNGFGQAGTAAVVATNPWTAAKYTLLGEGVNYSPYLFGSDRTLGDMLADNTSWMSRDTGNKVVPFMTGIAPSAAKYAPRFLANVPNQVASSPRRATQSALIKMTDNVKKLRNMNLTNKYGQVIPLSDALTFAWHFGMPSDWSKADVIGDNYTKSVRNYSNNFEYLR